MLLRPQISGPKLVSTPTLNLKFPRSDSRTFLRTIDQLKIRMIGPEYLADSGNPRHLDCQRILHTFLGFENLGK